MASYLLGIDNGSTMIKAAIYTLQGKEVGVAGHLVEATSPSPGWYERDMDALWQANVTAIRGAIEKAGINPEEILAVSVTGHGNGAHLLDENRNPLCNTIEGADSRALSYIKQWEENGSFEKLHPRNMQILWPALSVLVMAWLKDNRPELYGKAKYFLNAGDYLRFCLTGELHSEISVVSGTGLINTAEQRIDKDMLAEVGLAEVADMLPPLVGSTEITGRVTPEAAALTGLAPGTPVVAGCYDIDAAALATGAVDESRLCVITGTWANNQYIGAKPVVAKEFFSTTVFSKPGHWLMLEGSPTSASNLEWFVQEFLQEEAKQAKQAGTSVYDICNQAVAGTTPEETSLVFVPFLYGSNAKATAQACFVGLQGWQTRIHVIRAIYEGICFSHRWHIEKLLQYLTPPEAARIAGGGAKSQVWTQMFADILGFPMEAPQASELGALGAAICAAVGVGAYPDIDAAVAAMVPNVRRVEPNPHNKAIYDKKYANYKRVIQALESYWD